MKLSKSTLIALLAVVMVMSLSSCHRGIGCPSDFSILDPLAQVLRLLF